MYGTAWSRDEVKLPATRRRYGGLHGRLWLQRVGPDCNGVRPVPVHHRRILFIRSVPRPLRQKQGVVYYFMIEPRTGAGEQSLWSLLVSSLQSITSGKIINMIKLHTVFKALLANIQSGALHISISVLRRATPPYCHW